MLEYSTTDLNTFLAKAEHKLVELGEKLITQITYDTVENCLLDKIILLSDIIDAINDSSSQDEIDVLVFFALDYYNLYSVPYSPFSIMPTTVLDSGSGGSGGVVSWFDIIDKPDTFTPSYHTHPDEDIVVSLTGITEVVGGFNLSSFSGTLEELLEIIFITYQAPSFTSFAQEQSTSYALGQCIGQVPGFPATPNLLMNFSWSISNTNVSISATGGSITVSEANPFVSNLPFNLSSTLTGTGRTLSGTYTKTTNTSPTLTFFLNGLNSQEDAMNQMSTSLTWYSEIWYGNNTSGTLVESDVQAFNSTLTNTRQLSFTIVGSGYKYIFIPDNINQTGITFMSGQFAMDMLAPINLTVTNDFGVDLAGKLYRSRYSLSGDVPVVIS